MLRNEKAQSLCSRWCQHPGSAVHQFSIDGIWQVNYHLLYLNEIQEQINLPENALHPFIRSRRDTVELDQLKHFFEQKGNEHGITTLWHRDFYGLPIPFTSNYYKLMNPICKLV